MACASSRTSPPAFHDAGLEVVLYVVYNLTAEGSELGPTLSFKGIDNACRLVPDHKRSSDNDADTGNTLHSRSRR
jgi:glycogen operon protein